MDKAGKKELIEGLTTKFAGANNFYFADASHLTVDDVTHLRRICHKQGVEMRVAKNTFIRKAMEATGRTYEASIFDALHGPTSVLFSETSSIPAKVIKEFRKVKNSERPLFKAAYIDSAIFTGNNSLDELAKLKTKNELIGEIIGLLQSPAKNLIAALQSGGNKLGGIISALEKRGE